MLNKWKLQTCKNYEFGHFLQAIIHRKRGNLQESLKYIKLCHMIDQNNPTFIKELAKTLFVDINSAAYWENTKQHSTL